jgi:hypothetical protein
MDPKIELSAITTKWPNLTFLKDIVNGQDVNYLFNGYTALWLTINDFSYRKQYINQSPPIRNIVSCLLKLGADPNIVCKNGETPLIRAVEVGLHSRGCSSCRPCFDIATFVLNILYHYNANPNVRTRKGVPLLFRIIKTNCIHTIEIFKDKLDFNVTFRGVTPLHYCVIACEYKNHRCYMMPKLIELGCNPFQISKHGYCPYTADNCHGLWYNSKRYSQGIKPFIDELLLRYQEEHKKVFNEVLLELQYIPGGPGFKSLQEHFYETSKMLSI